MKKIIAILFLSTLIGCAQPPLQPITPQPVYRNPILEQIERQRYYPVLEFIAMQNSTLWRNSVLTIAPMQSDVGDFASSLEIALAQKYRTISSISNNRATTTKVNTDSLVTTNNVTYTKATHVIKISYSGVREVDQYYATTFNAQIIRVSDGSIEGVIRRHAQGRYLFSSSQFANQAFEEVVAKMP